MSEWGVILALPTAYYMDQVCSTNQKLEDTNFLGLLPPNAHVRWYFADSD